MGDAIAAPDRAMLAAAGKVASFIATGELAPGAFADGPVTIIENYPPYVFEGEDAVERWAAGMRVHAAGLSGLVHSFGPAFDFTQEGETAYFSLPTTWRGTARGRAFVETGGWAFVLRREAGDWKVAAYAWAVTGLS